MSTRADRRTSNELRPLAITQSVLTRSDGSAKFSFGSVTTLSSITGPSEVRIRDELVDRATLEINVKPLRGLSGPSSKSIEILLLSLFSPLIILNLHARSLIQINLQTLSSPSTKFSSAFSTNPDDLPPTLESEGKPAVEESQMTEGLGLGTSEKACLINSTMLALLDSSIECRGIILAVAVAFLPSIGKELEGETEMIIDPTPLEELKAKSCHLFSFSFGQGGNGGEEGVCVGIDSIGRFSEDELFDAQELALNGVRGIQAFVRKSIEKRYNVIASSSIEGGGQPKAKKSKKSKSSSTKDDMEVEEDDE